MSDIRDEHEAHQEMLDVAPGNPHDSVVSETVSYVIGLALALLLTGISFWVASTSSLWGPGVAVGLVVLAIAQMGVHLVFFLHITSGPDNTNNVLALAFGVLIVFLVMIGTIWIMAHMNANMGPSPELMNLQLQH
jgi:cytochrome o ubiquinol oxidase operon protein cyoD